MKKLLSGFLVVIMVVLTMAPVSMAAVTYPEGITAQQAENAIGKTDLMIYSLLKNSQNTTLRELLMPMICSSETMSMLTVEVYKMLEQNSESLSMLKLDVTPAAVAVHLTNYPAVAAKLSGAASWAEVNLDGVDWAVGTKEQMANAAAAVFGPLNDLLYTLLCAGSYSLNILIGIEGEYGYQNAVVPILQHFGCESITDPTTFYADAANDKYSMVRHIVADLFSFVEGILDSPCSKMTELLPGIAYYMNNGGLENAIQSLISPLKVEVLMFKLPIDVESLMNSAEEGANINFDINIGDMISISNVQTAPLDMNLLASCGTVSGDTVVANKGDTFITVLRWLIETVKLNQSTLPQMLGGEVDEQLITIMNTVLSKPTDDLISVIIGLFNQTGAMTNDYRWLFSELQQIAVSYTPNLGQDKYQRVLDGIDDLLNQFVAESGEAKTVREALQPQIYSNTLVSELAVELYSMLTSKEMEQVTGLLGVSLTPSALASVMTEDMFGKTRQQLSQYFSWTVVKKESLTWGFKDGDKNGFINAVTAVLRPMDELFRMMLAGGKIQFLGAIDIYGSDGYNTAIIPVLEAFGVYGDSIPSYSEYITAIQNQDAIKPIVTSLCSLIERVLDKPVYTITEILPNLLYFLNNGGIDIIVNNMLYPVMTVMQKLDLSSMINISQLTGALDINKMIKELMSGMDLGMTLPDLDINQFQGMGQLTSVVSKRTQSGSQIMIYAVDSDQTAVLITLLRYLVTVMKTPGNEDLMTSFMGGAGAEGGNDMFATYSSGITEELAAMTVDETVEWLYKLFFRERAVVEEQEDDYIPTVIYEEKYQFPWGTFFSVLLFIVGIGLFLGLANRDKIRILLDKYKEKKELKAFEAEQQEV